MPQYSKSATQQKAFIRRIGYTRERSSGYHLVTVNHWLQVVRLAKASGIEFSPAFHERLQRVAETEWKTIAPNGDIPHLGDTRPRHMEDRFLARLRRLALLFQMPEAKYIVESLAPGWSPPYEDLLPDGGREAGMGHVGIASHNVATVDSADHISIENQWRWNETTLSTVDAWKVEPDYA